MSRLWRTLLLGCLCAGCSGQTLVGRWKGGWPYDGGEDCRTQIMSNGRFELVCSANAWVGVGRWERSRGDLRFSYIVLSHEGRIVQNPQPVTFSLRREAGNQLELAASGKAMEWSRILPSQER